MRSQARMMVRWGIALAALAMLAWYVGPATLFATLREMRPLPVLAYAGAFLAVPFLYGLQLHGALRLCGQSVGLGTAMAAAVQSWSIGSLTPARAGDLSLAYWLRGEVAESRALAFVVADKLLSLVALAAMALAATFVIDVPYRRSLAIGTALVLGAVLIAFTLVRIPGADTPLRALVRRFLGVGGLAGWEQVRRDLASRRFLLWIGTTVGLRWMYICLINLIIFRAVEHAPGLGSVVAATAVGRLISIVPVSIGGLGIKEPAQILIYGTVGVPADAVVAVSVVGLACGFAVAALAPLLLRSGAGRARP